MLFREFEEKRLSEAGLERLLGEAAELNLLGGVILMCR